MREAHLLADDAQPLELVRVHVTRDWQVVARGLQVLAEGEHVDLVRTQVAHDLLDLVDLLAQAEHQAGLGRHFGMQGLEAFEQVEAPRVVGARPRLFVQPRHGFEVVVEHVGRRVLEDHQRRVHAAAEVRDQHFDREFR